MTLECSSTGTNNGDFTYGGIIGTGGATLAVGNLASPQYAGGAPSVWVDNACSTAYGTQTATLDMSGLDNFTFAGNNVCAGGSGSGTYNDNGTLILAKTNFIEALQPYAATTLVRRIGRRP